jgi:hypothetical protein
MVSLDALAFVRFGLRAPDDPRIVNTVKVIDATLKVETPRGAAWHRYQGDGYGEHPDGEPFDGRGMGRAWPLLTGERGHYELAAGRTDAAGRLAEAMGRLRVRVVSFPNRCGIVPISLTALRVETLAPAIVPWSADGWSTAHDTATRDTTLGVHVADLDTRHLRQGDRVDLPSYWPEADRWEAATSSCVSSDRSSINRGARFQIVAPTFHSESSALRRPRF